MVIDLVNIASFFDQFSLAEAKALTFPLLLFVVGVFIYVWFIFKFYPFLSKRDIFELNLQQYSESFIGGVKIFLSGIFYVLEYVFILPFFAFFWFGVVAVILAMLSKSNVESMLLIAMVLVGSIRMTAYYKEDLSKDLAKILPFALLGVFLVNVSFFSWQASVETLKQFPSQWKQMMYYLIFIVLLEILLRIVYGLSSLHRKTKQITQAKPLNAPMLKPINTYITRPQNRNNLKSLRRDVRPRPPPFR